MFVASNQTLKQLADHYFILFYFPFGEGGWEDGKGTDLGYSRSGAVPSYH
jgi:hypothetical protein